MAEPELCPGDTVIITFDPRCPRLAGLSALYQEALDATRAVVQIGTVGATVPPTCLRRAVQRSCTDCGRPFLCAIDAETRRCARCEEEDFDPANLVTDEDVADVRHPERESGLDWEV